MNTNTRKQSSVRHTRAVQRSRSMRQNAAPPDEQIAARLTEVVHPATLAQVAPFHPLGLRERMLTLPVLMAFVVRLIWRQLGSVCKAVRVLRQDGMRWCSPMPVSQQAVEQRLNTRPATVCHAVLPDILPRMQQQKNPPCGLGDPSQRAGCLDRTAHRSMAC